MGGGDPVAAHLAHTPVTGWARFLAAVAVGVTVLGCATEDEPPAADEVVGPEVEDPDQPSDPAVDEAPPADDPDADAEHPPTALPPPSELALPMRAAWVHLFDGALKARPGIDRLVDELVAADATAVIAQVARRHDAYYDSEVLPPTADPDLEPGLDVVAELTAVAHAAGLEVHAWISVAPTWHAAYEELPAPPGWLAVAHGATAPEEQRWVSRTIDGEWTEYLDPALPEVRDHVAAVVTELAETTAVDGIHLDYVRYADERSGYHPAALDRYRSETGAVGTPAPDDPAWSAWRRAQTRELIAHVRAALAAAERQPILSAAVITWGQGPAAAGGFEATRTATEALQDWPGWVRDELVDAVIPMTYFRSHEVDQAAWFTDWLAFQGELAAASGVAVVPGIGAWLNQTDAVIGQVQAASQAADGAVVYSYQQPTDEPPETDGEVAGVRPFWAELAERGWGGTEPGG
jgi:uncharacterized lipoprotein YddW (UPF0748 family)